MLLILALGWVKGAWAQTSYEWVTWSNGETYYSVQENLTDNTSAIQTNDAYLYGNFSNNNVRPTSPTGYWALVPVDADNKVYKIINAYYGEGFVLGCNWNAGSQGQQSHWKMYPATQVNGEGHVFTEFIIDNSARNGVNNSLLSNMQSQNRKYVKLHSSTDGFMWAPAGDRNWRCYTQAHDAKSFMKFETVEGVTDASVKQYWQETQIGQVSNASGLTFERVGYEASTPFNISQYARIGNYLRVPNEGDVDIRLINSSGTQVAVPEEYKAIVTIQNGTATVALDEKDKKNWTVIIRGDSEDGYTVSVGSVTAKNNETLALGHTPDANDLREISIDAPANKFVWGPVVNEGDKTITFTIKNPVTELTAGKWYQVQVLPKGTRYYSGSLKTTNNMVDALNGLSQMQRKSKYLYFYQHDTHSNNYPLDIAGYYQNKEALSYIYVPNVGGSATQINAVLQTVTGRFVDYQGISSTSTNVQTFQLTPEDDLSMSWNGGMRPWDNLGTPQHLTLGYSSSSRDKCFFTHFAEVDPTRMFDVYKVDIMGATDNSTVTCNLSNNNGIATVYNNGYFFFEKGQTFDISNFTLQNVIDYNELGLEIEETGDIKILHFKDMKYPHELRFSEAPSDTDWSDDTHWYTWRNNRNQGGNRNQRYVSTSANFVNNNFVLHNESTDDGGSDRGGLWCFVGNNEVGFKIQNAAYGPAFVLAFVNNGYTMVPKDNVPQGATIVFTYDVATTGQSQHLDGAAYGYLFRHGLTGSNQIHSNNTGLIRWDGSGSLRKDDGGSVFKITEVEDLSALEEYDVYQVNGGTVSYTGSRAVFGKRSAAPYIILKKGEEIVKTDLTPNVDIETLSVSEPSSTYIKSLAIVKADEYSPAPVNSQWTAGTKWFTWRSNRSNQQATYNKRYMTIGNGGINDSYNLVVPTQTAPTDRQGYWCFVGDNTNGFMIQNAAYGPDFILIETGGNYKIVHKSEIPSGANYLFTHDESTVKSDGGAKGYTFRIGLTGVRHIHHSLGALSSWDNGSNGHPRVDDTGSSWQLVRIDEVVVDTKAEYTPYKVSVQAEGMSVRLPAQLNFEPASDLGGKTTNLSAGQFVLIRKDAGEPQSSNFSSARVPEGFTGIEIINSSTTPSYKEIILTGKVNLPRVVHRPNGNLWRAQQISYDGTSTNTIGTQTDPYTTIKLKNGTTTKLQNTATFEITHFLAPGETRQLWMPSTATSGMSQAKVLNYMRWFDFQNESLPDFDIVDFTPSQSGDVNSRAWYYLNGLVCGSSVRNSGYPTKYVNVTLPSSLSKTQTDYEYTLANEATRYADFSENFESGITPAGGAAYLGDFVDPNNTAEGNENLLEPTIGQRQIFHLRSAHEMATKLSTCVGNKWLEEETITFPTRSTNLGSYKDVIPLAYSFCDYWAYNNNGQLSSVKVKPNGTNVYIKTTTDTDEANSTGISIATANCQGYLQGSEVFVEANNDASRDASHFVSFSYPADGIIQLAPGVQSDTANIYVRLKVDDIEYNIKKFTIVFQSNTEPLPYREILSDDNHIRSDKSLAQIYGTPSNESGVYTEIAFHYPHRYLMGAPNAAVSEGNGYYAFPYNFNEISYSYYANGASYVEWDEYGMRNNANVATYSGSGSRPLVFSINYLRLLYKQKKAKAEKERAEAVLANPEADETTRAEAQYELNEANGILSTITEQTLKEAQENNYYIYVDASEQPGKLGSLSIKEQLCTGTRIYGTAWLSCGTSYKAGSPVPASVIFRFKGVKSNGEKVNIYSYCPGQISNIGRASDRSEVNYYPEEQYNGTQYNEAVWQQVAFSFTNTHDPDEFDSFELEIDNNCRGSGGGDIYLDNVRLFVKTPQVQVENAAPICGEELSIVRISTDFDALIGVIGVDEEGETIPYYGTYVLLDKEVYDNHLASIEHPTTIDVNNAFLKALIGETDKSKCYDGDTFLPEFYAFHEITFFSKYERHNEVSYATLVGDNILTEAGRMYRRNAAGEIVGRNLVYNCKIIDERLAGREYYLVFYGNALKTDWSKKSKDDYAQGFNMGTTCCILSTFRATRAKMVRIEGNNELDPYNIDYCPGYAPTISLSSYGYDTKGELIQEHGVYYDWYFGTKEQYKNERVWLDQYDIDLELNKYTDRQLLTAEDFNIESCLRNFRYFYPVAGNKELFDGTVQVQQFKKDPVTDAEYELTQKMIDRMKEWISVGKLRLHMMSVNVNLAASDEDGMTHVLAIQQGAKLRYAAGDTEKQNPIIYCMDPVEVSFRTKIESPSASIGLAGINYDGTPYNRDKDRDIYHSVPMRVNKKQIDRVRTGASAITLPLRVITPSGYYKVDEGESIVTSNDIHLVVNEDAKHVFVVETNDPQWTLLSRTDEGVEYMSPVGELYNMDANKTRTDGNTDRFGLKLYDEETDYSRIFSPREGYYYVLRAEFWEVLNDGIKKSERYDLPDIQCKGNILIPLKIVPEYMVWTGKESDDWNNDRNWVRADYDALYAGNKASDETKPLEAYMRNSIDSKMNNEVPASAGFNGVPVDVNAKQEEETDMDMFVPMDKAEYAGESFSNTFAYAPMTGTKVLVPANAVRFPVLAKHEKSTAAGKQGLLTLADEEKNTPYIIYDMVAVSDGENYVADTYYDNHIEGITFAMKSCMENAHLLNYDKAWVEYELNAGRWYTIATPLKDTYAGDWYSPTAGAKQLTPHFYDITYNTSLNDRFRPAYYQRSWDREGSNVVYEKTGAESESYVKADWSYVYNDAAVSYNKGGFCVKPEVEYMQTSDKPEDGKVTVRLPKADKKYTYYDKNGQTGSAADAVIGETRQNRLLSDDLGSNGAGEIAVSVTNQTADNKYFLVSNPFMAPMDMTAFFTAHSAVLEPKYWIVDGDHQTVSVKAGYSDEWTSTDGDGRYVAPLQSFFVKMKDEVASTTLNVAYTADMQQTVATLATTGKTPVALKSITRAHSEMPANNIVIKARRDGYVSTALVVANQAASNGFVAGEDCEAFVDGNMFDQPTVYTAAAGRAMTINTIAEVGMLPLGVVSSNDEPVNLSIETESSEQLYLYDAETREYTPVDGKLEMVVSGNTSGRYYFTTSILEKQGSENDVKPGVWTVGGVYCGESLKGMKPGIYVTNGVKVSIR